MYGWLQEEMQLKGLRARNWGELSAMSQIAWRQLFDRLFKENQ
jgi:hypothetical protein